MVQLGFYFHMKQALGITALTVTRPLAFALTFMLFVSIVISLFKDIPDIKGDRRVRGPCPLLPGALAAPQASPQVPRFVCCCGLAQNVVSQRLSVRHHTSLQAGGNCYDEREDGGASDFLDLHRAPGVCIRGRSGRGRAVAGELQLEAMHAFSWAVTDH